MQSLHAEICRRFPEIRDAIDETSDEPYMVMWSLVQYLSELSSDQLTPELIDRVVAFSQWCEDQPAGKSAADDLRTILVVGFYEELLKHETTRVLIPYLIDRQDFTSNESYIKSWCGEESYTLTLALYGEK